MRKIKRIIALFVCATVLGNVLGGNILALNIGEEHEFQAGNIVKPSVSGNGTTSTRTYEQRLADSTNKTATNEFSIYAESYLKKLDLVTISDYVQEPDRYVFVYDDVTYKPVLLELATYKDRYNPKGYWYKTTDKKVNEKTVDDATDAELDALGSIASGDKDWGVGPITEKTETEEVRWEYAIEYERVQELEKFVKEVLIPVRTGKYVREFGQKKLVDFKYYKERFEALQEYLTLFSVEEYVDTKIIIEYKLESVGRTALRTSTPINWPNTNQTHLWEFVCETPHDGLPREPITRYGGNSVKQAFYYAGDYRCTATQILSQSYYDAITYTRNVYWVIAETGQIIYKDESKGSSINLELPMAEQKLDNVYYYNKVSDGVFYVTVLDQDITVTQNMFNELIDSSGVWEYNFSTKRLK